MCNARETDFCVQQEFSGAANPMVIVGSDVLQRPDADAIYSAVVSIASSGVKSDKDWKTLNVLHRVSVILLVFFCYIPANALCPI